MTTIGWLGVLLALLGAGAGTDLLRLDAAEPGAGLPPGWRVRAVRGQRAPTYEVVAQGDTQRVLRVSGAGHAAFAYRPIEPGIADSTGTLAWSWRVLDAPDGADLQFEKLDDSALRVYVVFGKPGGLFGGRGRVIFYTWGNAEPAGLVRRSFVSDRLQIVRVAGAMEADGRWRDHRVRPFDDFRRSWPGVTPPPVTAVGIMQDTDMTRAAAVAELRTLVWEEATDR